MKEIIVTVAGAIIFVALAGGCGAFGPSQTYCLEEKEANGLDYMIVSDERICDNANADAEWYVTNQSFKIGDIAYVEADGNHSVKHNRRHEQIKKITTPPPYKPTTVPNICLRGYAPPPPKPATPKPAVPKPAPAPTVKQPAPITPKQTVASVTPKPIPVVPNNVSTAKPGC